MIISFQENNEIFSLEHGERILQKTKSYLLHPMYANCLSNIAKNTSKSLENIAQGIVLEVSLQEVKLHQDRELNLNYCSHNSTYKYKEGQVLKNMTDSLVNMPLLSRQGDQIILKSHMIW